MQLGGMQERKPALASQCVGCGACVKHCPQSIDIPVELKKVVKEFEGKLTTKPLMFVLRQAFSRMGGRRKKGNR
jgi:predicted aldo/keto reductase-like oxidoreductase